MADVLFIALMAVFCGLCVALIRVCDRIIGPDDEVIIAPSDGRETEQVIAT